MYIIHIYILGQRRMFKQTINSVYKKNLPILLHIQPLYYYYYKCI